MAFEAKVTRVASNNEEMGIVEALPPQDGQLDTWGFLKTGDPLLLGFYRQTSGCALRWYCAPSVYLKAAQ